MSNQRHVSEFAELDGGGWYFGIFFLRGCKSNRKFYRGKTENDIYHDYLKMNLRS